MKSSRRSGLIGFLLLLVQPSWAGIIFQNFEPDNGAPITTNPVGNAHISLANRIEAVHLGVQALKTTSSDYWTGIGVQAQVMPGNTDLKQINNDRLTFWTFALPHRNCYIYGCEAGSENTVGVTFYDHGRYSQTGFEVWTTQTARYQEWSKLKILFSQLPPDFDLHHVTRVEFKNYQPGTYYFDDIHAVREDRIYQSFEKETRSGSTDNDYGWKWNSNDTVETSPGGEPAFEGTHSWKLISTALWGGTGIQSQEKRFVFNNGVAEQSFWHVDLAPQQNDRLTFWVYALPANGMDNNINVQFYDNGAHFTDATKVEFWTKKAAVCGRWTRLTVPFSELKKIAPDLNLSDINKIQLQSYWPGTYYFDEIRVAGVQSSIQEQVLSAGTGEIITWQTIDQATNYRLQESVKGPNGPWKTIYSGPQKTFITSRLCKSWLRVRWEESFLNKNTLPYASDWSEIVDYLPPAVVFSYAQLKAGLLIWSSVPQAMFYEIQSSLTPFGPWNPVYKGKSPIAPLYALSGMWYRIRAINEIKGVLSDLTAWSRPQLYDPMKNFVKAHGTQIKDADGTGNPLILQGVNLGGGLVIEPWMTGLGSGDTPPLEDDWSIRQRLAARFGQNSAGALLQTYQNAYIQNYDFDRLLDQGVTLVRLPFYYRDLQNDNGQWILNAQGQIDFSPLDRIVNALADRGIYTLLDMHGAPGLQSADATTGRKDFNQLFSSGGEIYRTRTEEMWREIAKHYRDNRWVLGYDLLNEPVGAAPDVNALAAFYDRLYHAIRLVDPNHLIVMEGIWFEDPNDPNPIPRLKHQILDWDTLPSPQSRGWTNVMYQFHFYHWDDVDSAGNVTKADDNVTSHKTFIDQKVAEASVKQALYNVPLLIGEFYGFNTRSIWDYYLQAFNANGWSWTSWSYKFHDSPSTWGMVTHANYNDALPDFGKDSSQTLTSKLNKYRTPDYHLPAATLREKLQAAGALVQQVPSSFGPYLESLSTLFVTTGQDLTLIGRNFGNGGTVTYGDRALPIIAWSDISIHASIPGDQLAGSGLVTVTTPLGVSGGLNLIVQDPVPNLGAFTHTNSNFSFSGSGLGDTPGTLQFYPAPCQTYPPADLPCNKGDAAITFWSDSLIKGVIPPDAADLSGRYKIQSQYGGELYPTMIRPNQAPVFQQMQNWSIVVRHTLSFLVKATDADKDALTFTVVGLPTGATFMNQQFVWTPQPGQQGIYPITFRVTDGQATIASIISITVK